MENGKKSKSEDVFELALMSQKIDQYLVHGVITIDGEQRPFAWVEKDNTVFDAKNNKNYDKEFFYNKFLITKTVRYNYDDANKNMTISNRYGWWNNEIFDELNIKKPEFKDGIWSFDHGSNNES